MEAEGSEKSANYAAFNRLLFDEYSCRLLHMHQYLMTLWKEKQNQRES